MIRYAVIRVPSSGPPALAGSPNVFATREAAKARIAEIEADHLITHHTYLDVIAIEGPLYKALAARGIAV